MSSGIIDAVSIEIEIDPVILSRSEAIEIVSMSLGSNLESAFKLADFVLNRKCPARHAIKAAGLQFGVWRNCHGHIALIIQWIADYESDFISVPDLQDRMWEFFYVYQQSVSKNGWQSHLGIFIARFQKSVTDYSN